MSLNKTLIRVFVNDLQGAIQYRTVLLIRNNAFGWRELRGLLKAMSGIRVIGEVATAQEARDLVGVAYPDVILSAAVVEGRSCVSLLTELRTHYPESRIVIIAARIDADGLPALLALGIRGYLFWADLSPYVLQQVLATVLIDKMVISTETVLQATGMVLREQTDTPQPAIVLTERERAVLEGLAAGLSREEIAFNEKISISTVKRTIADLAAKLEAPSLFVLGLKATRLGLIS